MKKSLWKRIKGLISSNNELLTKGEMEECEDWMELNIPEVKL